MKSVIEALESRRLLSAGPTGWYTVDDYQYPSSTNLARQTALAKDAAGNLFAAGFATDPSGRQHGIVREKLAGSTSWNTILDYNNAQLTSAAVSPDGTLYVGGESGGGGGIVLALAPGATQPTLVDSSQFSTVNGLLSDAAGNVFAAGSSSIVTKPNHTTAYFIVREKPAGQSSFHTVDSVANGSGNGINVVPTGASAGLYAVGHIVLNNRENWLVRKSADGGATWATVDNFNYDGLHGSNAGGITGDGKGNVFVSGAGSAFNPNSTTASSNHWLVRESSDGGQTWRMADDWQPEAGGASAPGYGAIGLDGGGNVCVAGYGAQNRIAHAIVRSNSGVNGAFVTIDDYQLAPNTASANYSFISDNAGASYAGGGMIDASGASHWVTRDPPAPGAPIHGHRVHHNHHPAH